MPKKLTTKIFIERATKTHGNRYDYSLVKYINSCTKISIICQEHGIFHQMQYDHIVRGDGCPKCRGYGYTTQDFIKDATVIHNDKYDYTESKYIRKHAKIKIICPKHGLFEQITQDHLTGHGCWYCGFSSRIIPLKRNTKYFVEKSSSIHGDTYDYSHSFYIDSKTNINIKCHKHGDFHITPSSHYRGAGCPSCTKGPKSKKEHLWLDMMYVPRTSTNRNVKISLNKNEYIIADGYIPEINTIYEFWGDYWHGNINNPRYIDGINHINGKSFFELYEQTLNKKQKISDAGFILIDIWEQDFDHIINNFNC